MQDELTFGLGFEWTSVKVNDAGAAVRWAISNGWEPWMQFQSGVQPMLLCRRPQPQPKRDHHNAGRHRYYSIPVSGADVVIANGQTLTREQVAATVMNVLTAGKYIWPAGADQVHQAILKALAAAETTEILDQAGVEC